jgi:hypothetical protein
MNILFRENASKNEKIFTIFSLLWMVLAIYGMWINFDSNIGLNTAVIISSILWGIAMVYPLSIDNHPSNKLAHASALKKVSTILLLTLAASGFSWCILALSIPAIYTENFGKPTSEIVQVKRKYSAHRKGCDPRIETTNNNKYCVPLEFFNNIEENDTIVINGKVSALGYRATNFETK